MNRSEIKELHYITPIENLHSILSKGILSHKGVSKTIHTSVALEGVQDRREGKTVPGGKPLHDYVNLYFHARNPMMFKRKEEHALLCVLCISPAVLDMPHVIVTDMNAAKDIARFRPVDNGLLFLDYDAVFASDWRHPGNAVEYDRHKGIKCAEVLVPDCVPSRFVMRIYASCQASMIKIQELCQSHTVTLDADLFFN